MQTNQQMHLACVQLGGYNINYIMKNASYLKNC